MFDKIRLSFAASTSSGGLSRHKSVRSRSDRTSTQASTMVTSGLSTSTTGGHEVEKKCSLLGRFIFSNPDRSIYTNQIKYNLPTYLNTSEKVRLKVGRHSLTLTDRTIWQNKLDRIPNSLLVDCHVDLQSPKICYFVNETVNNRYQVLAFLCKSAADSQKLVNNCPSQNKTSQRYHNSKQRLGAQATQYYSYSTTDEEDMYGTGSTPTNQGRVRDDGSWGYKHSNSRAIHNPSNHHVKERKPATLVNNNVSAVQQYDSDGSSMSKDKRGYNALQRNTDGVARIVVGGNEASSNRNQSGLTIVGPPSRDSTLHKTQKTKPAIVEFPVDHGHSLKMVQSPSSPRKSGDGSQSPDKHFDFSAAAMKQTSSRKQHHTVRDRVEDDFKLVMTGLNQVDSSPGRTHGRVDRQLHVQPTHLRDHTNLEMVATQAGDQNTDRRRKGQYRSIQEYEAAQTQQTIVGGLQPLSGTENIEPQMTLVLRGTEYAIQDTGSRMRPKTSPGTENMVKKVGSGWQFIPGEETGVNTQPHNGLQLIRGGTFNQSQNWKSSQRSRSSNAHNGRRIALQPDTYQRPTTHRPPQMDIQPQQVTNQLQIYTQPSVQPKYNVKTRGRGDNFMKDEALEVDDDHKYYRQHGQRVKKTDDGGEQLFLDNRMAETNDVIGNQMVQGKHAQKVHSGETVGANHRSKFHSEVRVSHQTSRPMNGQQGLQANMGQLQPSGRQNSQPVNVTTHQWPSNQFPGFEPKLHFTGPDNMFQKFPGQFPGFRHEEPIQRFFRPELNPHPPIQNPGFQRFFESINSFGPHAHNPFEPLKHRDRPLAVTSPKVETPSDNDSETSSIRSSASAYWPPELRFPTNIEDDGTESWKFHKPMMKLRRKNPGNIRQPIGHNPHLRQRMLL